MAAVLKRKVVIVDDHPIVRKGVRALLSQESDLVVCGEAENLGAALDTIAKTRPDIAIVDITLKGSDGIELIKAIRHRDRRLPILVMSMYEETMYAERVLRAGGNGYIMKEAVDAHIVTAIRKILAGDIYVGESVRLRIYRKMSDGADATATSPIERLSDRELEVFRLLGTGKSTRQIAEHLHLSVKTIETYRAHIKEKLHIATSPELMRAAVQYAQA